MYFEVLLSIQKYYAECIFKKNMLEKYLFETY